MRPAPVGGRVLGKCWRCHMPVRTNTVVRLKDPATGVVRKLHRGECEDRARVLLGLTT